MTIPLDALALIVGMLAACYLISWVIGRWERCRAIIDTILRSLDQEEETMFYVGEKVHWTHTSLRGKNLTMQRRDGEITALISAKALVRRPSGKRVWVSLNLLRKTEQQSQISEFVEAMRESAK